MEPGLFLIAIFGCGEADAACTAVRTLDTRYPTQAACTAAAGEALAGAGDVDAPVVVAQCLRAGAPVKLRASGVRRPAGGRADLRASPLRS